MEAAGAGYAEKTRTAAVVRMVASAREEPDEYAIAHVREALAKDGRVNELHVRVEIDGNRVILSGNVTTPERRAAASDVVAEVLPGYEVDNRTTVHNTPGGTVTEDLE